MGGFPKFKEFWFHGKLPIASSTSNPTSNANFRQSSVMWSPAFGNPSPSPDPSGDISRGISRGIGNAGCSGIQASEAVPHFRNFSPGRSRLYWLLNFLSREFATHKPKQGCEFSQLLQKTCFCKLANCISKSMKQIWEAPKLARRPMFGMEVDSDPCRPKPQRIATPRYKCKFHSFLCHFRMRKMRWSIHPYSFLQELIQAQFSQGIVVWCANGGFKPPQKLLNAVIFTT